MTGYQRAKLTNFGDVLIFDCKRSGITTLEWPKPVTVIFYQEGKLCETCTGMVCVENHDMEVDSACITARCSEEITANPYNKLLNNLHLVGMRSFVNS